MTSEEMLKLIDERVKAAFAKLADTMCYAADSQKRASDPSDPFDAAADMFDDAGRRGAEALNVRVYIGGQMVTMICRAYRGGIKCQRAAMRGSDYCTLHAGQRPC